MSDSKREIETPVDGTTDRNVLSTNSGSGVPASVSAVGTNGAPRDLISLDEVDMPPGLDVPSTKSQGGGTGDTLMQAAEAFEQQLQQMSSWKHQLANQMELLRRDGIKMLERQKNLAIERRKVQQEREEVMKEKGEAQALHDTLDIERKRIEAKAAELEKATEGLLALQTQKEKWLQDVGAARLEAEKVNAKRTAVEMELAGMEGKLAEYRKLEAERDTLLKQISEARSTLTELGNAQRELAAQRQEIEKRAGEIATAVQQIEAREKAIGDIEAGIRQATESLETQRQALEGAQNKLVADQNQLTAQIDEHAKWLDEARRQIETEQVSGKQMIASANERLTEIADAQKNFEIQKQDLANRSISLEAQELQVAKREKDIAETVARLKTQEETLKQAQEELAGHQSRLTAAENTLAGHRAKIEAELNERLAQVANAETQLKTREDEHHATRSAGQASLDERESAIADELEQIAKKTKRLNEKRAQIDAEAAKLDAAVAHRVKAATEQIRAEAEKGASAAAAEIEQQKSRCAALEQQIKEFGNLGAQQNAKQEETAFALAKAEARVKELQGDLQEYKGAADKLIAAQDQLTKVEAALAAATSGQEELEAEFARVLEAHKAELAGATATIAKEYEAKLAAAALSAPAAGGASSADLKQARETARMYEMQRDELGAELIAAQDALAKARDEASLIRSSVEGELTHLRVRCEKLENENLALEKKIKTAPKQSGAVTNQPENPRQTKQRARLLAQARTVRAYRKQQQDIKGSLEKNREEIAHQREQLQQRKENLEQVKRLLEKQEMVMARKLADHSAIKTVAAVVFSVVMILGGTFWAVYKFVSPVYGSEALVQVTPPAKQSPAEETAWLGQQNATITSQAVTFEAWKKLRSDEFKYGGHESREEWLASLPGKLSVKNTSARTISIQYESNTPEGAAQVSNALALAYAANLNAGGEPGHATAADPVTAYPKQTPTKDTRLMTALTATAAILAICLIAVMLGRYYIRRQLREIDRMADDAELEDIKGEIAT